MTALASETQTFEPSVLGGLLSDDTFWPTSPADLDETGLSESFVEALVLKTVLVAGTVSGRNVAERTGMPRDKVAHLFHLVMNSEFKRYQYAPTLRCSDRCWDGRRFPVSHRFRE